MIGYTDIDMRLTALLAAFISIYIMPSWVHISLCFLLVLIDSLFGLLTMKKRSEKFSLKKLIFKGMILKYAVYFPVIIAVVKIHSLYFEPIFATQIPLLIIMLFIFWYEINSIKNHFILIRGGNISDDANSIKKFFEKLREIIDIIQKK